MLLQLHCMTGRVRIKQEFLVVKKEILVLNVLLAIAAQHGAIQLI